MDYIVTWIDGAAKRAEHETAQEAFALAKTLIDNGKAGVEIAIPSSRSVIKGRAILDIYHAIENPDA
jgi:hypothetical protein